jgi:hypothetical protein
LEKFYRDWAQWVRDYRKRHAVDLKYLVVPEQHKDGAWHMHGFLMGLPLSHLMAFGAEHPGAHKLMDLVCKGAELYDWLPYRAKFGFCDLEPIRDRQRVSSYVTKYITKDLSKCVKESGKHLFRASLGLKGRVLVKQGYWRGEDVAHYFRNGFQNDFTATISCDLMTEDGRLVYESVFDFLRPEHEE